MDQVKIHSPFKALCIQVHNLSNCPTGNPGPWQIQRTRGPSSRCLSLSVSNPPWVVQYVDCGSVSFEPQALNQPQSCIIEAYWPEPSNSTWELILSCAALLHPANWGPVVCNNPPHPPPLHNNTQQILVWRSILQYRLSTSPRSWNFCVASFFRDCDHLTPREWGLTLKSMLQTMSHFTGGKVPLPNWSTT